jgi:hypothetical protein
MFESALQSIVAVKHENQEIRFPRVQAIATQIQQALQTKAQTISGELELAANKRNQKLEIKQKAQKLIQKGFSKSVSDFMSWLYLPKLQDAYQFQIVSALQQGAFSNWEYGVFKQAIAEYEQSIMKWVHQACEFFDYPQPAELSIPFPSQPQVILPEPPQQSTSSKSSPDVTPIAFTSSVGWILGGPVGAVVAGGASYLLNKLTQDSEPQQPISSNAYLEQVQEAYNLAAKDYLTRFSNQGFSTLAQYQNLAEKMINIEITKEPLKQTTQHYQLQLLQTLLANLNQELEVVSTKLPT